MNRKLFILFILIGSHSISNASKVNITVDFIDHEKLILYNFDPNDYANYQVGFQDSITTFFKDSKIQQNVKIIQTLDPNLFPFYSFSAKPALADSTLHQLQKLLMSIKPVNALYMAFSSEITVTIKGGCKDRGLNYTPKLTAPLLLRKSKFQHGDYKQNFDFLMEWLELEGMPLLLAIHNSSVKQNGVELTEEELKAFSTINKSKNNIVEGAIGRTGMYWSVLNKLGQDKTLILFKAMVTANEGRIQYAQRCLQMIYQFEPNNSLLRYIMDQFNWRMNYYFQKEQSLLSQTSNTYNEESLSSDLDIITTILSTNMMSGSALARLFTLQDDGSGLIKFPRANVYNDHLISNPMCQDTTTPNNPEIAYFNYLRGSTVDLFIDAETFESDFPKYAEIALKLEDYEFAADLYFMLENQAIVTFDDNEDKYRFRRLYALHKLSATAPVSKKNKKFYKRLDKKIRKDMKKHPRYKKFKK